MAAVSAPEIGEKMAKLLRLACSTGPDGEKLAALSRLTAIAAAHDLDWDRVFAGGNGADLSEAQMQRIYEAGYERGLAGQQGSAPAQPDWSAAAPAPQSLEYLERGLSAAWQADAGGQLNDFEETFSRSIRQRIARYGSRSRISEKQWCCIERLAEGLERAGYLEW
jgi:hypothetical protein